MITNINNYFKQSILTSMENLKNLAVFSSFIVWGSSLVPKFRDRGVETFKNGFKYLETSEFEIEISSFLVRIDIKQREFL